jgi:hypothetical protein
MPHRMSVTPPAIHTFAPAGNAIMRPPEQAAVAPTKGSIDAGTTMRRPLDSTISILVSGADAAGIAEAGSDITATGANSGLRHPPRRPARYSARHRVRSAREISCRRAVADTARGRTKLSSTMRTFSSPDQRRRRPLSVTDSTSTRELKLWASIASASYPADLARVRRPAPEGAGFTFQVRHRGWRRMPLLGCGSRGTSEAWR